MDRVAFNIGGLAIHWYGILAAVGFGAGLWTASRRAADHPTLPRTVVADLGPWLIVGGLVGARLWFVISYWDEDFAGRPLWEILNLRAGGLVFYGGLAGAALAAALFARLRGLPLWELADVLAPSLALGHAFGRVGCYANGCCYGAPTRLPWGVPWPDAPAGQVVLVHPTQLYEAGLLVCLCLGLAWQYRRKRFAGQTFAWYLIAYALVRFTIEFFRGDYGTMTLAGLKPGQALSAVALAGGVWLFLSRRPGSAAGTPPSPPQR